MHEAGVKMLVRGCLTGIPIKMADASGYFMHAMLRVMHMPAHYRGAHGAHGARGAHGALGACGAHGTTRPG